MMDAVINADQQLFLALNGMHSAFFDFMMFWLSDKLIWIPLYLWLLYRLIRLNKSQWWLMVVAVVVLVTLTDQVSVQLFKNVFHRLRPCHDPGLEGLVRTLNGHCGGSYGFVSSHACNTAGVAIFAGMALRSQLRWLLPVLILWSVLISYSRIYLGVHFPGDVLAGFSVGALIGYAVFRLWQSVHQNLLNKTRNEAKGKR